MQTLNELFTLAKNLEKEFLEIGKKEWGGADVVITSKQPPRNNISFYPEYRYVVTNYPLILSRLFEKLRDAFYLENRIDSCSKIEFFCRLANAANRCIGSTKKLNQHILYASVLHEAFSIYIEMEFDLFQHQFISCNDDICDDYVLEKLRSGYVNNDETAKFFKLLKIQIYNY
jgi:hypothetical protein